MAKVTSKLQVTIPKNIAEEHGIAPGDEIEWSSAGDSIRITPAGADQTSMAERLRVFDAATTRQRRRQKNLRRRTLSKESRGWTRQDLYSRGGAR